METPHCIRGAVHLGEVEMLNSITRTMLTSAMGFARDTITAGERIVAFAERWGADEAYDLRAPYSEIWINNRGENVTFMGEQLERFVNWLGMKLGYLDGEVSGWLADRNIMRYGAEPVSV
jgi:hypothetical protein